MQKINTVRFVFFKVMPLRNYSYCKNHTFTSSPLAKFLFCTTAQLNTCFGGNGLLQNQYISYLLDSRRVDGMKIACEKIYPEWPATTIVLTSLFKSGRPVAKKPNLLWGAVAIFKRKSSIDSGLMGMGALWHTIYHYIIILLVLLGGEYLISCLMWVYLEIALEI